MKSTFVWRNCTPTLCVLAGSLALAMPALSQPSQAAQETAEVGQMTALSRQPSVQKALAFIERDEPQTKADTFAINAISAPTFAEERRASDYAARLTALGLHNVHIDAAGNALGTFRGTGNGPTVAVAAHLDTVYPMSADLTVREKEGRYYAPGIADNARSLAAILVIVRALKDSGIQPEGDIIFCANVGEEGLGDLKGVKHLFNTHPEISAFIGLEPVLSRAGDEPITYISTGSRRFKITFKGPGGHSYEAFGKPSAIHAMGRSIAHIDELRVPTEPKVTFNVGVVDGGQSVNTISGESSMLIDMRSDDKVQLAKIESDVKDAVRQAVQETNKRWNSTSISADVALIGDRPAGRMAVDAPIVQAALAAASALGRRPVLDVAHSVDANLPMSRGIPSITMTGGGDSGGIHSSKDEWWSPVNAHIGPQNVLLTVLGLTGVKGVQPSLLAVKR